MATSKVRAQGFLLHSTPYKESSLIVDLFTREYGRIAAVAKGAKRPASALRPILLQFQPILVTWSGRGELRTLTAAEWMGGIETPRGDALLCAFYMNELLIRMLAREDAHPGLFDAYSSTLAALAAGAVLDESLRHFEWQLLRETGHAPALESDAGGHPILAAGLYAWQPGTGFTVSEPGVEAGIAGKTLLELAAGRLDSPMTRTQAKYLARAILSHQLDGQALRTRQILLDLQKL